MKNTSILIAVLLSVFALPGRSASLGGTSVTGSLTFSGDPSNYFDPGYGFVPPGDLNNSGTTVTISDSAVEFGYDDGVSNAYSADFTGNGLTITDVAEGTELNLAFTMTFVDPAFANLSLVPVMTSSLIGTYSLSGDVITLTSPGGNVTDGEILTSTFAIGSVPEPSSISYLFVSLLLAFVGFGIRKFRQAARAAR